MKTRFLLAIITVVVAVFMSGTASTNPVDSVESVRLDLPLPAQEQALNYPFAETVFLPADLELPPERFWNDRTKSYMTDKQIRIMLLAYEIGESHGGYGEALQAIVLQESIAGLLPLVADRQQPAIGRSYGAAMVKPIAAKEVFRLHPELNNFQSDEALFDALKHNHRFNLLVAVRYLHWLVERTDSLDEALVAYNLGLSGSRGVSDYGEYRYTQGVSANLTEVVRPFNQAIPPVGYRQQVAMLD